MLSVVFLVVLVGSAAGLLLKGYNGLNSEVVDYVGRFDAVALSANWPYAGIKFNIVSLNSTTEVQVEFTNCAGN